MSSFPEPKPDGAIDGEPNGKPRSEASSAAPTPQPVSVEPSRVEFGPPAILAVEPAFPPQDGLANGAPMHAAESGSTLTEAAHLERSALESTTIEQPLFVSAILPEVPRPVRIPHLGHVLMLLLIFLFSLVATVGLMAWAVHDHLYGVTTLKGTPNDIHYTLGSEALMYLLTLIGALIIFPLFWNKSLFSGLQWNAATARRLFWKLEGAAIVCVLLALVSDQFLPGPKHAPIEDIFREPGAAWLLFVFGVTFAPFFEEMFFRGFLLPALATACDWIAEKFNHAPVRPLAENGHPRWSLPAVIIASILTSIPFAALHAAQTGYSLGPFVLLVCVSLVLCAVRLRTRSLASSTVVHATYNFILFATMIVATHGFRHMDKM